MPEATDQSRAHVPSLPVWLNAMQTVAWIVTRDREIAALAGDNPPHVDSWITQSEADERFWGALKKLKKERGRDPSKEEIEELNRAIDQRVLPPDGRFSLLWLDMWAAEEKSRDAIDRLIEAALSSGDKLKPLPAAAATTYQPSCHPYGGRITHSLTMPMTKLTGLFCTVSELVACPRQFLTGDGTAWLLPEMTCCASGQRRKRLNRLRMASQPRQRLQRR